MSADPILDANEDGGASELFHENSKQRRSDLVFIERIIAASASPYVHQLLTRGHKRYPSAPTVSLPMDFPRAERDFDEAMLTRRSIRTFTRGSLSLGEVAKLLHFAAGITGWITVDGAREQPLRASPSAGALYPVELYLLAVEVQGLERGTYHYDSFRGRLEVLSTSSPLAALRRITFLDELAGAGAVVAMTGISAKSRLKYGERGYRFTLFEAGHIAQNLLLTAHSLGLAAFAVGGFVDDELDALLNVDGVEEVSLYLVAVGRGDGPVAPEGAG
ncbi:MAG TPA: SagB/ThcOx family dehydrogenase [Candidatus Dormibacteraeota bacterium]|nr:SagB/ThcOx family dehydrogenase [Candidatus Dormibacteraeota bacterium]